MHKVGIIPFDMKANAIAVLFVTSQTRGRWVLPKGAMAEGESHVDTCHREGFEEAGVRGKVLADFPITALIGKKTVTGVKNVPVTYYPYLVREQLDDWPEADKRQRHWALLRDAAKVVHREDLLGLIKQFEALAPWIRTVAEPYKSSQPAALTPAQ